MTAPLTLPGTIPGLLRRGSPVIHALLWSGVVHEVAESSAVVCTTCYAMRDLALDLTDATGRAHAAWWLAEQEDSVVARAILNATGTSGHGVASGWLRRWSDGRDCKENHVRALANTCLHVAGLPS